MKIYLVGGAVRDKLLGLPVHERDWVVVGANKADIDELVRKGYRQVGKEFPVYLHPKTGEEYALARIERKTGPGYKGFSFVNTDVSLEDDLQRRDLTINAMAEDTDGNLIDPYHGKEDLQAKLLRHVSPAFAEDPVRILRVGRFLARYAYLGFKVAPETITLMQEMVAAGEVDALVAERVWKELERALGEKNPEKFFEVLADAKALPTLFPHLSATGKGIAALKAATAFSTRVRFAALLYAYPETALGQDTVKKPINEICDRYRVPNQYRELAVLTALHHEKALKAEQLTADELVHLFSLLDIYRREARFKDFIEAVMGIAEAQHIKFDADFLLAAATIAKNVDVQELIKAGFTGNDLAEKLKLVRQTALAEWLQKR